MATAVIMPRQGQSVETCILGQWYKEPGDPVKQGDPLFSYETDKASFEEEAKADGILLTRLFEAGEEVPVLAEIAWIGEVGEEGAAKKKEADEYAGLPSGDELPKVVEFAVPSGQLSSGRIHISPLARNMAEKLGVDPTSLIGTGPQGRIIARDISAAGKKSADAGKERVTEEQQVIPSAKPVFETAASVMKISVSPAKETTVKEATTFQPGAEFTLKPVSNIRKLIAKAMHQSLQNSAQLTHHLSADARNLLAARKKFKKDFETGVVRENVTINDLVCFALIRALKRFPQVNTHYLGDQVKYFNKVHLGLAVDTDRGLMVPALRDADDLSVTGLSSRLQQIAADCRKGNINPDLLSPEASSFTVSNLGNYGVEIFTPVINLPQTAILGVCAIIPRPKDIGEGIYAFVPMIGLSLTYDHRALDGGEATRFLAEIRTQIENI
jgi:pyruvate dehydrogenase E2 component (dihydrolipoamide acetyltransferase)